MATFRPQLSTSVPNPANAYRPGRAIVDANRAGSEAIGQGLAQLRSGVRQLEARTAQADAEAAQKAAAAAARDLIPASAELYERTLEEAHASGHDLEEKFFNGFTDVNGIQLFGWKQLVDERSEGMSAEERKLFQEQAEDLRLRYARDLGVQRTKRGYAYATDQSIRRAETQLDMIRKRPDTYREMSEVYIQEILSTVSPGTARAKTLEEQARREAFGAYVEARLTQGVAMSFDDTSDSVDLFQMGAPRDVLGADILLAELDSDAVGQGLSAEARAEVRLQAQRVRDQYLARVAATQEEEIKAAIAVRDKTGLPQTQVPESLIDQYQVDPGKARQLKISQRRSVMQQELAEEFKHTPGPMMDQTTAALREDLEAIAASGDATAALAANDMLGRLEQVRDEIVRRREEDFAKSMTEVDETLGTQQEQLMEAIVMASQAADQDTLDRIAGSAAGVAGSRAATLATYAQQGFAQPGQVPNLLTQEAVDYLRGELDNAATPEDQFRWLNAIAAVSGDQYGRVARDLFANDPTAGVLSIAAIQPRNSPVGPLLLRAHKNAESNAEWFKKTGATAIVGRGNSMADVNSAMAEHLAPLAQTLVGADPMAMDAMSDSVQQLALELMRTRGLGATDGVKQAKTMLVDQKFVLNGSMRYETDMTYLQDALASQRLFEEGGFGGFVPDTFREVVMPVNAPGLWETDRDRAMTASFTPYTAPEGDGVVFLFDNESGDPVRNRRGDRLKIPWEDWVDISVKAQQAGPEVDPFAAVRGIFERAVAGAE